jgi:AcrR family transcriptional regulator
VSERKRPPDRRRRILDAAAALFAEHGFAATSVGDIAAAEGITDGALYRHFASKEQLLETLALGIVEEFNAVFDDLPAPADERLAELVWRSTDVVLTRAAHVAAYARERTRLPRSLSTKLRRRERQLFESWRDVTAAANPALSDSENAVRQSAVNGIFAAFAERRHTIRRPRLDALAVGGVVAVVRTPPVRGETTASIGPRTWSPPRSRRVELVEAAAALFRRYGYAGAGVDDIAEATGIAGPTVYGTFASKAEILADIYDHVLARLESASDVALDAAGSASEALDGLVAAYIETAFSMTDLIVVAGREGRELAGRDRARVARRRAEQRHTWAEVLLQVRPELSEAEARTLVAASFSLVHRLALGRRDDSPTRAAAASLATAFLLAPPAAASAVSRAQR